jgi:antitoxin (DNA-binding transcriptional repressor) of toxin-antitoxin stability system
MEALPGSSFKPPVKLDQVNIHHAKTHLSRLIEDVAGGAEVLIAKGGKPMARLVPLRVSQPTRRPGVLKGRLRIGEDFDAPVDLASPR